MIVYVTRHGQPAIGDLLPGGNNEFPPGDPGLTQLGTEQAALLGKYLKSKDFKGKILSSPYSRTLFTAQEVAAVTKSYIYPEKAIQEYVLEDGVPDIEVMNFAEIKRTLSNIAPEATLDDQWLFSGTETEQDVYNRVKLFIDKLLVSDEDEVLIVGHGASVGACKKLLFKAVGIPYDEKYNWNCSLSRFVINEQDSRVELNCDISFMPEKMVTSNMLKYREQRY